jgi:hypothetical protein
MNLFYFPNPKPGVLRFLKIFKNPELEVITKSKNNLTMAAILSSFRLEYGHRPTSIPVMGS